MLKRRVYILIIIVCVNICGCALKEDNVNLKNEVNVEDNFNSESEIKSEDNSYFFPEGTSSVTCKIRSNLSGLESKEEIELKIIELKKIEDGMVYELKIDYGKEILARYEDNWDRRILGYFYVKEDKIYFMNNDGKGIDNLKTEEDVINNGGKIVCQEKELGDSLAEDERGWHEYIEVNGECREYHGYNTLVESGFYEQFSWEKGKGLVKYASGWGAEGDSINLEIIK